MGDVPRACRVTRQRGQGRVARNPRRVLRALAKGMAGVDARNTQRDIQIRAQCLACGFKLGRRRLQAVVDMERDDLTGPALRTARK